jgi:site-specific recombinase XerD
MPARTPKIRTHKRGYYFVRWGGKDHYLGSDLAAAEQLFFDPESDHPGALHRWMSWQSTKSQARQRRAQGPSLTVAELFEMFLEHYALDGRDDTVVYYRKQLTRFLSVFGAMRTDELDIAALHAFLADLKRLNLAPRTVRHDINAVKTMLRFGANRELAPVLNLDAVRAPRVQAPTPTRLPFAEVCRWMRAAHDAGKANLAAHIALNYLCLARPSEVLRLVSGEGEFQPVRVVRGGAVTIEPRGIFVLERWKTEHRTSYPRHLVLTDTALSWLEHASPEWSRLDSYSPAVRRVCGPGGPKLLQKAAAWHLQLQGVDQADVDLLLGHEPSGAWRHYVRREWSALRERAARISI